MMDTSELEFARTAILAYLHRRPDSADTVEGIHSYWISWPAAAPALSITEAALQSLRHEGQMMSMDIHRQQIWRRAA